MQSNPRFFSAGLTLIEVVVALAIAALLTGATLPAVGRALERARVSSTVRELVVALKAARQHARSSGSETVFVLDVGTKVYWVAEGRERTLATPQATTLALLTAESERLTATAGAIRFFPDGSATGGTISMTHRGRTHKIEIDWLTGHVRALSL